jgi:predicted lipid-binding transport protein (Tim44 family)
MIPARAWHRMRTGMLEVTSDDTPDGHAAGHSALLIRRHRYTGTLSYYRCWTPVPAALSRLIAVAVICWRIENYFRYARTHFALDALDSHAATPDNPDRMVPNPAKKAAAAQTRRAEALATAAEAHRDASLAALRNPPPGQPATITNQTINALNAPVEAAWAELDVAKDAAAATPARIRLAEITPAWSA